jgi:hypothetical protein
VITWVFHLPQVPVFLEIHIVDTNVDFLRYNSPRQR